MSAFLSSIKSDLLSRRLLPLVVALGVLLAGAVIYAASGGGSTGTPGTPGATSLTPSPSRSGRAPVGPVRRAPSNLNEAVAETPGGARFQRQGPTRNPFASLGASSAATPTKTAPSRSTPAPSPASKTRGSGPAKSSTPSKPKRKIEYRANVELGPVPTLAGQTPQLTVYKGVKSNQALPTRRHPLVLLKSAGLSATSAKGATEGKSTGDAVFALARAPILSGPGTCLPSATQCESIKLEVGQTEELGFLEPNGQTVGYLLKVALVVKNTR